MITHIVLLTTRSFNLETLDPKGTVVIHRSFMNPAQYSTEMALLDVRAILNEFGPSFNLLDRVFVVMEPTVNAIAMFLSIYAGCRAISITPEIWIMLETTEHYLNVKSFAAEGEDWANTLYQARQKQAAISNLEKP
jgi:hypothetical protein